MEQIKVEITHREVNKENNELAVVSGNYEGQDKTCVLKKLATCKCDFETSTSFACGKTVNCYTNIKTKLPVIEYQGKIIGLGWQEIIELCINVLKAEENSTKENIFESGVKS